MVKIVVWGVRGVFGMYEPIINSLIENKKVCVVGVVDRDDRSQMTFGNIKVHKPQKLLEWEYDQIVVTSQKETYGKIISAAGRLGVDLARCVYIMDFLGEHKDEVQLYYEMERGHQYEILREVLGATDEEIADYNWMYN